jgi:hypothetical protein
LEEKVMKRIAKWMGILISVLFLSGSAWGYNAVDHIKVSPNQKGDLLLFKYYVVANGGWETKISVTNTNMGASVVAKVIIRSYKNSTELLDFLIFLSPADVWTAKLYWDGTQTKIYSEDSSCLNAAGNFASPEAPLDFALKTIGTTIMPFCPEDSTAIGYTYVVQSAWSADSYSYKGTTISFATPGVPHAAIKEAYDSSSVGDPDSPFYVWTVGDPVDTKFGPNSSLSWNNSLMGYQVFSNATLGLYSSAVQALAMNDYKSTVYLKLTETNRLGIDDSNNTLAEIEAAIAKEYLALPYVEGDADATVHVLGFPTKYTKAKTAGSCTNLGFDGPFFIKNANETTYTVPLENVRIWDVNEVYSTTNIFSPSPTRGLRDEVNLLAVSAINGDNFPEGWVSYPFAGFTTGPVAAVAPFTMITYSGAPVVSTVVFFGALDSYSIDGAWSEGAVSENGTDLPGYQYADVFTIYPVQ